MNRFLLPPSDYFELTVDTNTVHRSISLSNNNRMMMTVLEEQPYLAHPEMFMICPQVLCSNGLTGHCYWEVEWKGRVYISVAYKGIGRNGNSPECWFGENNQSWSLLCSERGYSVLHNGNREDIISISSSGFTDSNRIAVYVNYPDGMLSFYMLISDVLIELYTFNTTFAEPLYPGFGFGLWSAIAPGSSVHLCSL